MILYKVHWTLPNVVSGASLAKARTRLWFCKNIESTHKTTKNKINMSAD